MWNPDYFGHPISNVKCLPILIQDLCDILRLAYYGTRMLCCVTDNYGVTPHTFRAMKHSAATKLKKRLHLKIFFSWTDEKLTSIEQAGNEIRPFLRLREAETAVGHARTTFSNTLLIFALFGNLEHNLGCRPWAYWRTWTWKIFCSYKRELTFVCAPEI